jgi:beta-glucanase (GH16 family)
MAEPVIERRRILEGFLAVAAVSIVPGAFSGIKNDPQNGGRGGSLNRRPKKPPIVVSSLSDSFNSGSLSANWLVSVYPAPGDGVFAASMVDLSQGMLCLKLTQTKNLDGSISSVGGQIQSVALYGYGTYEWVARASSTSITPNGSGWPVSGSVTGLFNYINNSQTEITFEVEGGLLNTVWMTNWISETQNYGTSTTLAAPDAGFHRYKFIWQAGKIDFYIDGNLITTHTINVPSAPAYILMNHWGTDSATWGGLATPGVERYVYVSGFSYTPLA